MLVFINRPSSHLIRVEVEGSTVIFPGLRIDYHRYQHFMLIYMYMYCFVGND